MSRHIKKIKDALHFNKKDAKIIDSKISKFKNKEYIAIYDPECIGIMNSTISNFKYTLALKEVCNVKMQQFIVDKIIENNIKTVIFNSITYGWKSIVEKLKISNNDIKIKFIWHGSFSMFVTRDESYFFYLILDMLDRKLVNSIGFAKESMYLFYKQKGYNAYFVPNTVQSTNIVSDIESSNRQNKKIKIGIYSAGDRWEKNLFNQLSATTFFNDSIVDILPSTKLSEQFCDLMNIEIIDKKLKAMSRDDLLNRMSKNDINLYVTFTECSPMMPLESFEQGVICITGNNHHYFKDSKLEEYVVVKSEDDVNEIRDKINLCLNNKKEILELYKIWKKNYDLKVEEYIKQFLNS